MKLHIIASVDGKAAMFTCDLPDITWQPMDRPADIAANAKPSHIHEVALMDDDMWPTWSVRGLVTKHRQDTFPERGWREKPEKR